MSLLVVNLLFDHTTTMRPHADEEVTHVTLVVVAHGKTGMFLTAHLPRTPYRP
jgi:hypothetical protein